MTQNQASITAEQAVIIRVIQEELTRFGQTSAFNGISVPYRAVGVKFKELQREFPEVAAMATAHYESYDAVFMPRELVGFEAALFRALVDLESFYNAEGFNRVVAAFESSEISVFDLATFCEAYDSESGQWKTRKSDHS